MTNEKKLTVKRLIIFLLLAFAPTYIVSIFFVEDLNKLTMLHSFTLMLPPAIAHVITRLITKEGFSDSYLRLNFKGNIKYYFAGLIYTVCCQLISAILLIVIYIPDYRLSEAINGGNAVQVIAVLFYAVAYAYALVIICFGEEFGWRAYLTPKLEKLMPTSAALIVSGVIWGLWHAPMILRGYNFGSEHKYAGLVMMCAACIFYGVFLTWLTKRTNSIYPAAICHSCIDTLPIVSMLVPNAYLPSGHDLEMGVINLFVPAAIFGIIAWIMIIRDERLKTG